MIIIILILDIGIVLIKFISTMHPPLVLTVFSKFLCTHDVCIIM